MADSTDWIEGLPSVEAVREHEEWGGWWQTWDGAGPVEQWRLLVATGCSGLTAVRRDHGKQPPPIDHPIVPDWPARRYRSCTEDGTPLTLANRLRESEGEAATLRDSLAVACNAFDMAESRLAEALARHMLHDDGRGWAWERAAKVLDVRADEAATLRARLEGLTGPEMRERIMEALDVGARGPGFTIWDSQADSIMTLLRGETGR